MSLKKLTAENAVIKTASVEVKTLTISGKQVTLAVFRQLPRRELFDGETLALNGIAWGTVNYHPDKCHDEAEHIHVVWQDKQSLARFNFPERVGYQPKAVWHRQRMTLTYAHALIGEAVKEHGYMPATMTPLDKFLKGRVKFNSLSRIHTLYLDIGAFDFPGEHYESKFLLKAVEGWNSCQSPPAKVYEPGLLKAIEKEAEWLARYSALYKTIANLDQLYIAV